MVESSWPQLSSVCAAAPYPVVSLPVEGEKGRECLTWLGVSERSWLGAVVANSAGLLVDHGWLRILGSGRGDPKLRAVSSDSSPETGVDIGEDVLGGQFRWFTASSGLPATVHYFAPDTLEWQDLGLGYGDWLSAMLTGSITDFYQDFRWPGWENEVAIVRTDHGIHTYPPLFTAEGKDVAAVSRRAIPMTELADWHAEMRAQLSGE